MNYAIVFPGQGAQSVGMGKDLYDNYSVARDVFDVADEALEFSLSRIIFEGPETDLTKTAYTQPAILTMSVAVFTVLQKEFGCVFSPEFVAGHSLGEYTALVAAGSLSLADGVRLVHARGELMQNAVPEGQGAMAAILGMSDENVKQICEELDPGGVCQAANYNSPGQVVISGSKDAVEKAVVVAKERGARRAVMLKVSAPFHCSLMRSVAGSLAREMEKCVWNVPAWPLVANVSGRAVSEVGAIRQGLYDQTYSPVLWSSSVNYMLQNGVDSFLELGPGTVLAGLIRKCQKGTKTVSIGTVESLSKAIDFLKGDF